MPGGVGMIPFAVGKERIGLVFFHQLLEHGMQVLKCVALGVLEVERVVPLVDRMIDAKAHGRAVERVLELAQEVAVGADVDAVPVPGVVGLVEAEAVVVLGDEIDVARAGLDEYVRPAAGVEQLGGEALYKVLVASVFAVNAAVERRGLAVWILELLPVPLGIVAVARVGGDGIQPPMDEDPELGIAEPLRDGAGVERRPVVFVHAG